MPTHWSTRTDVIWRKIWALVRAIFSLPRKADKWEQIESNYYHACRLEGAERQQYLKRLQEECESVYREVVALLPYSGEKLDGIPPPVDAPQEEGPRLQEGDILGEYRIIRLLGRGTGGEVYLAQDPELPRKVALKVLSTQVDSGDLIERFKREARAVSALNHPYILTIHEFKQLGDLHYIVTEHVEGQPLRGHIGKLSQEQAMEFARQIAEALKAAHAAGIVHRDIKPENIMVHPNGYVKVLDFGLAKPTGFEGSFPGGVGGGVATAPALGQLSEPGMLMGTLPYMSPEHLVGKKAGPSSDVWAWGVVLYEMLCGRRPFTGLTQSEVSASILECEPVSASDDKELNRLIGKALCKDPHRRYQSMAEAIEDLERIQTRQGDAFYFVKSKAVAAWEWIQRWRTEVLVLAVPVLTVIGIYLATDYFPGRQFRVTGVEPLTGLHNVLKATISPDEKTIAFTTQEADGQRLWIRQLSLSMPIQELHRVSTGTYSGITFGTDSRSVYFVLRKDELGKLYRLPVQGGVPKMVLDDVDSSISFSPDGGRMAFFRIDSINRRASLVTKGLEVSPESTHFTLTAPDYFWTAPVWSGDGCCLLFGVLNDSGTGVTNLKIMSVDLRNGHEQVIGPLPWYWMGQPVWSKNGHAIIVPATGNDADRSQLLEISGPRGKISALLVHDGISYRDLEWGREQRNLVTVQEARKSQPWILSVSDGTARPVPNLSGTFYGAAWTPRAEIISQTDVDGHPDLWVINPDTGSRHAITHDPSVEEDPSASPNGHIAYASNAEGAFHIWVADGDGSPARRLTDDGSREEEGSFTPDGSWVVYTSIREGFPGLWMAPANGGPSRQISRHPARRASVSPNGHLIVCDYVADPRRGWITTILDASSGDPIRFIAGIPAGDNALPVHWSADGMKLIYAVTTGGTSNLWEQPAFDGGLARQLTHFVSERIFAFAPSPDGKSVACIRGEVTSDVALVGVAKQESIIFIYKGVKMTTLILVEIVFVLAAITVLLSFYRKKANKGKRDDGSGNDGAGTVTNTGGSGPHG
jgi:eukaryotic-like serine/threonine-protein kinase